MIVLIAKTPMGICPCGLPIEPPESYTKIGGTIVHFGCENKTRGTETASSLFALTAAAPDPKPRRQEQVFAPVKPDSGPTNTPRLVGQIRRVYELLSDEQWWSLSSLATELGCLPTSASSRARDLRRHGYTVLRRRRAGIGREYRLVLNKADGVSNAA